MKTYLISLLCTSILVAGTYDNTYMTVKSSDNVEIDETGQLMNGEFLEIKRFYKLQFTADVLSSSSEKEFEVLLSTIKSYLAKEKNILVQIIGHTSQKTDIYNQATYNEDTYSKSVSTSKMYADTIAKRLEDNQINKDLLIVEHRASKDLALVAITPEDIALSNRVMVSMYVLAPKDKDSDVDTVLDSVDKCTDTPEGVQVDEFGCPYDNDKDIVLDYMDDCLDTPFGVAVDEKGCPFDTDTDGVLDYKDKCPQTIIGLKVDAEGCHISRELKLNFATKSAKIQDNVYSQVTEFAEFLNTNTVYNAEIIGHTDSVGKAGYNMTLSLERANAVRNALVKEGIDENRLKAIGKGELSPLETNRTKVGRKANRRIEVKLFN